jgi:SpoVK/Ycf46/Vps4 family AAA+-type ATPase
MESVVLKSAGASAVDKAKREELEKFLPGLKADDHDKLDLATLLNVLDGVRETPGRIIILSTNHPERLDEALLRPGRFDLLIHFKKHDRSILKQHVAEFYDAPLSEAEDQTLSDPCLDDKWTPAEVSQVLFKYIDDRAEACRVLVEEDPAMLFSLSRKPKDLMDLFVA